MTITKVQMTRWRCEHCRRSWSNPRTAREHAARCWYDPANRGCKTCSHFLRGFSETDVGLVEADSCAVEVPLPVIATMGQVRETLAVHCDSHRVKDSYLHPDVLDTLADSEPAT